jgi:hypothetical protein
MRTTCETMVMLSYWMLRIHNYAARLAAAYIE